MMDLPESPSAVECTFDQESLVKIVTNLVLNKPTTHEEAILLLQKLQSQLKDWLVSDLPAIIEPAQVEAVCFKTCFGKK